MQFFHKVNISVFVGLLVATLVYSVAMMLKARQTK